MTSTVIVAGARTPMGRFNGALASVSATELGGSPSAARWQSAGVAGGRRRLRDHGPGAAGRCRADPRPAGGGGRWHRDGRSGGHHQQGVSVRPGRDRAGRPADPRRRVQHRRRRRHGVHDPGTAPAARFARRLQVRRRHDDRSPRARRPARRVHRRADGAAHRDHQRPRPDHPTRAGHLRGPLPPAGRRRAPPPGSSRPRSSRSWSQVAAATSSSTPTRASAPDTTVETLGKLRPAFRKDGTITAGTASQISDGAAAVVVMGKDEAERRGLEWIAEITAHGMIAGPDSSLQDKPARAIRRPARRPASSRPIWTWSRSTRRSPPSASRPPATLGISEDIVNVNGGAIAMGHPIGDVRRPDRPAPGAGTAAPRRRHRGRHPVRRRRAGRRAAADRAQAALTPPVSRGAARRLRAMAGQRDPQRSLPA